MAKQDEQIPIQPVENPILCSPYKEPDQHWLYDTRTGIPTKTPGRRPASYWFKTERTGSAQMSLLAKRSATICRWSTRYAMTFAERGQRNVRATGVLAGERPLGFAVSNEVNARKHVLPGDYLVVPISNSESTAATPANASSNPGNALASSWIPAAATPTPAPTPPPPPPPPPA